jgi:hypothetical protein
MYIEFWFFVYLRESTLEVTKGIREYFNITLGLQLLYKWERPQFIQIMNDNPETLPSQLYGAFHLLRLFGNFYIFYIFFTKTHCFDNSYLSNIFIILNILLKFCFLCLQ